MSYLVLRPFQYLFVVQFVVHLNYNTQTIDLIQIKLRTLNVPFLQQILLQFQSILSTMNQFYPLIEQTIKQYSQPALLNLIEELKAKPGQQQQTGFGCLPNQEYVLKRLIASCLSRDSTIKFNSYLVLSIVLKYIPDILSKLNSSAVFNHIVSQTDHKKHCGGKPSEIQAYVIGKILIFKALSPLFKGSIHALSHLKELCDEFSQLQQQIVELLYSLVTDKKSKAVLKTLVTKTEPGFVLKILLSSGQASKINANVIDKIIDLNCKQYPKKSICLIHVGQNLHKILENPVTYLETKLQQIVDEESQDVNFRQIFYVLEMLKSHLSVVKISKQNYKSLISARLINFWLTQLRVQNKKIREVADSIKITFDNNEEFSFKILDDLHKSKVHLQNMNQNHPLLQLYEAVNPVTYTDYLLNLIQKQQTMTEQNEETQIKPYNELEFFITFRSKFLKVDQIAKVIGIFLNIYHSTKDELKIQSLSTLFNSLIGQTFRHKAVLNDRPSLILSKINYQNLDGLQNINELKKITKSIRTLVKSSKEEQDPIIVTYLNFLVACGFYLLIYSEETDIYNDLELVLQDLSANFLNKENGQETKKKRKLNNQQKNKPIHILVDAFISLLTKSPQFLRTAINNLFIKIIPFLDSTDLSHLLQVVQRPDKDYIQDLDQQQQQ